MPGIRDKTAGSAIALTVKEVYNHAGQRKLPGVGILEALPQKSEMIVGYSQYHLR